MRMLGKIMLWVFAGMGALLVLTIMLGLFGVLDEVEDASPVPEKSNRESTAITHQPRVTAIPTVKNISDADAILREMCRLGTKWDAVGIYGLSHIRSLARDLESLVSRKDAYLLEPFGLPDQVSLFSSVIDEIDAIKQEYGYSDDDVDNAIPDEIALISAEATLLQIALLETC